MNENLLVFSKMVDYVTVRFQVCVVAISTGGYQLGRTHTTQAVFTGISKREQECNF